MKSYDNLVENLKKANITEENYDLWESLLYLPYEIYVTILEAIFDGRITIEDLNKITADTRLRVRRPIGRKPIDSKGVASRVLEKYSTGEISDVVLPKSLEEERRLIAERLAQAGIQLSEEDIAKIFVDEDQLERRTLNYFEIELTKEDREYMRQHGLSEIEMIKLKMQRNHVDFRKSYRGGN